MIRRIQRTSDLRDLIKSCPSGVIDDIYKIEYYIQGYGDTVEAQFTKKGTMLEVILPTSLLEELPNGVLMRRAYYKTTDSSFPDGEYNLEFEDNLGVWLGDDEAGEVPGEYVTEEELAETLTDYATQDWVENELLTGGYLTEYLADQRYPTFDWISDAGYATQDWVEGQGFVVEDAQDPVITESVLNDVLAGDDNRVLREEDLGPYAQMEWVQNQGYITSSALSGYATESYVDQAIEDAISGSDIPLPENIVEYDEHHPLIEEFDINVDVLKRPEFDHGTDVMTKGLVLGYTETKDGGDITDIDTIEIRDSLLMAVSYSYDGVDYHESRDPYVTQSWIGNQGYITSSALSGYATETYVQNQGYITSSALSDYALESEVSSLAARISALETNYGNAITITNSILS